MKTIIISDLHLGSRGCQSEQLLKFLESITQSDTSRLILNGDVFDSLGFHRLKKKHWKILKILRKIAKKIEVIWIEGNHDEFAEFFSPLIGAKSAREYQFESGEKKILVTHGHMFDDFLEKHPVLTIIGDWIYGLLQWIDRTHTFARLLKKKSKTFLHCVIKVREKSLKYAESKGCQIVCCGHTHLVEFTRDGRYFNSGCWTEIPCSYLTVSEGKVEIRRWE